MPSFRELSLCLFVFGKTGEEGEEEGEDGEGEIRQMAESWVIQGYLGHCVDCGFYSEHDGKPVENFEHSLTLSDLSFTMIT